MARLAAKARMGYYQLPEGIARLIRSNLHFDHTDEYSAIDLFAGEGKTLQLIAGEACKTFGCELNGIRADGAKENLDHVIHGAAEFVKIEGSVSIHYFNPPYDDGHSGRLLGILPCTCQGQRLVGETDNCSRRAYDLTPAP